MNQKQTRYEFLRAQYAPLIADRLRKDDTASDWPQDENAVFERFATIDPSAGAKKKPYRYLDWVIRTYMNSFNDSDSGIIAEDFYKITDYLQTFDEHKTSLPVAQRDINRYDYDALATLGDRLAGHEVMSGKELKRQAKNDIYDQTTILYDGPDGMIVVPHSKKSSCFWGKGTRWCTAAEKSHNAFDQYNKSAPLIILIPSGNSNHGAANDNRQRYQYHKNTGLYDSQDKEILAIPDELDLLLQHCPLVLDAIPNDKKQILEEDWNDRDFVLATVKQDGYALINASDELQADRDIVLAAVTQDGSALHYASNELKADTDFILTAVAKNGLVLGYVFNMPQNDKDLLATADFSNCDFKAMTKNPLYSIISEQDKQDAFERSLKDNWRTIRYAIEYCDITLPGEWEEDALNRALAEDPDNTCMHYFPCFQNKDCLSAKTIREAADILKKKQAPTYLQNQKQKQKPAIPMAAF